MQNVILVIHIFACIAMTIVVLLQRSEGGALGIGGGGGGLMSGRGAAGALVRSTMLFGGIFFITSLALTTIANRGADTRTEVERQLEEEGAAPASPVDLLDPAATIDLGGGAAAAPEAPADPLDAAPVEADPLAEPPADDDPLAEDPR